MRYPTLLLILFSLNIHCQTMPLFDPVPMNSWEFKLPIDMLPAQEDYSSVFCNFDQCSYTSSQSTPSRVKAIRNRLHSESNLSFLVFEPEIRRTISKQTHSSITGQYPGPITYSSSTPVLVSPVIAFKSSEQVMMLMENPSYHWLSITDDTADLKEVLANNLYTLEPGEHFQITVEPNSETETTIQITLYCDDSGIIQAAIPGNEPPMDSGNGKEAKDSWDDSGSDNESGWIEVTGNKAKVKEKKKKLVASGGDDRRPPDRPAYKQPIPQPAPPQTDYSDMSAKRLRELLYQTDPSDTQTIKAITMAALQKCQSERKTRGKERYGMRDLQKIREYHTNNQLFVINGSDWAKLGRLAATAGP